MRVLAIGGSGGMGQFAVGIPAIAAFLAAADMGGGVYEATIDERKTVYLEFFPQF